MPHLAVVSFAKGVGVLSKLAALMWEGGVLGPHLLPVGEVRYTANFPLPEIRKVVGDALADNKE